MTPSEDEIYEQIDKAAESEDSGRSRWPGMTYEQGVSATLNWILGNFPEPPMSDD